MGDFGDKKAPTTAIKATIATTTIPAILTIPDFAGDFV
jgi:hypothetical protein